MFYKWGGSDILLISTLNHYSRILKFVAVILLDMARYEAQKGPMCLTCVPVTLCRKTFVGVGVRGGDINCRYITLNTPHVFICKLHITHIGNIETEHLDNKNIKTE